MHALDSTTGKLVWTLDAGDPVTTPPTASNGVVFLRSYTTAYALTSQRGRSFGATRWIPPNRSSLLLSWTACGI